MKILLIENDQPTTAILSEVLTAQCYAVDIATDGDIGLQLATSKDYDLVLLDSLISELDSISLCHQLRTQGFQKPILLLTTKDSSISLVNGLDVGIDGYVTKPYDLPELLAQIRTLLQHQEAVLPPKLLTWEHLSINLALAEVRYRGRPLSVSPREYGILGLFLRNPQRIFSRSDLIDRLWSIEASPSEGAVTSLVKDLQHQLKAAGMTTDLLETIYGLGYRLNAPPRLEEELADPSAAAKMQRSSPPENLERVNKVLEGSGDTFAKLMLLEEALQTRDVEQPAFVSTDLPVVLVIDPDISFVDRLKAEANGLRIEFALGLTQAARKVNQAAPDAVLLNLSDNFEAVANWLSRFSQQFPEVPVLLITQQDTLIDRVGISRLGAQQFLPKSLAPSEVIEAIEALLKQSKTRSDETLSAPDEAKVMILDDDPFRVKMLEDLLQPWGLQVTSLSDPLQFWDVLVATQPDLLLLDLQTSTYSGIDLCHVVRQDPRWGNLPILVITAYSDWASVQQFFAAGADDFISKPIVGPELVTRVISRINRDRLQQELEALKRRIST